MTWLTAALVVAATLGVSNIIDSHLLGKRLNSLWLYGVPVGMLHLSYGLIFLAFYPLSGEVNAFPLFVAICSAVARAGAIILMLYAVRTEEISRVIPVVNTYPIFVAILAVPLLEETLKYLQWLAIIMVVLGAALISVNWRGWGRAAGVRRSFMLLLACSVLFAVTNIATKYVLDYISFWNVYSINDICFGSIFLLLATRPGVINQLWARKDRCTILKLIAFSETIAVGAYILSFWAMAKGPVSLVSTILGTRPLFVFLYAFALSHAFPAVLNERFNRGTVTFLKIGATVLIVSGIALINI